MKLNKLIVIIVMLSIFAMSSRISMDTDSWWHLRAGQWIFENRSIPKIDYFSFTRNGAIWQYPGWLIELPMYLIYRTTGPGGLNLWTAIMVTLTFFILWQVLSGGYFLRAFVVIFAAAASGIYWAARPHLVTFLFSALFIYIAERYRWTSDEKSIKRLLWLPVLMMLWANSHGGFILGFIIWGVYFIEAIYRWWIKQLSTRNLTIVTAISLLMIGAVCINPSGFTMLIYPFKTIQIGALRNYIQEWQSPNFRQLEVQPFMWLMIMIFGAVGFSGKRMLAIDFLLTTIFAYLSLMAVRNIAIFALIAPIVITRHAEPILERLKAKFGHILDRANLTNQHAYMLNWVIVIVILLAVIVKDIAVFPKQVNETAFQKYLPYGAVAAINSARPVGFLFNSYNWGAFLLYNLPEYPVFVDGRTDLYDDEIINQWINVIQANEGWQDILKNWNIHIILIEPERPIVNQLATQGWHLIYQDAISVVYVH